MLEELIIGAKKYILIGTAHVSKDSALEVKEVIERERPDNIALELCQGRLNKLKGDTTVEEMDLESVFKKGQGTMVIANLFLSSYQKKIGESLGVTPGAEMVAGIEIGEELGIPITCADRPVDITIKRVLGHLKLREKLKGFWAALNFFLSGDEEGEELTEETIESLKNKEGIADSLGMLAGEFPSVKKYLIDERDQYLAYKIGKTPGEVIVAVLGAGHLEGVKQHLIQEDVTREQIHEISQVPKKKRYLSYIGLGILLVFLGIIIYTFIQDPTLGASNVALWLVLTCGLGALGAIIARAHPLTVLASVVGAPIGAALPFISTGLISGVVEAKVRKPKGKDLANISEDIFVFRSWWKNGVLRIFLVFFLVSLGSAIGNIIGLKNVLEGFLKVF